MFLYLYLYFGKVVIIIFFSNGDWGEMCRMKMKVDGKMMVLYDDNGIYFACSEL